MGRARGFNRVLVQINRPKVVSEEESAAVIVRRRIRTAKRCLARFNGTVGCSTRVRHTVRAREGLRRRRRRRHRRNGRTAQQSDCNRFIFAGRGTGGRHMDEERAGRGDGVRL